MDLVAQVEEALARLYHNHDAEERRAAQKWLLTLQHSPEAWQMAWLLLQNTKAVEAHFYAAATLAVKIHRYWNEVVPDDFESLRLRLFKYVIEYAQADGVKMVISKLCVALALLLLNGAPHQWPASVQSAVATFNQYTQMSEKIRSAQLEFLTVLPEEFHTHMHLSGSKKVAVRRELENGAATVFSLIESLLQDQSLSSLHVLCLRCLKSWIQFGIPMVKVETFLPALYNCLGDNNLCEVAIECLVEMASHPSSTLYPLSIRKLISLTVQLAPELERLKQECDVDGCDCIARIVVALVENHISLITKSNSENEKKEAVQLMKLLLEVTAMPGHYPADETVSEMTYNCWYLFIDNLSSQKPEMMEQIMTLFGNILMSLFGVLLKKVEFPADSEKQLWNNEELEQLRCYREDVGDTALYLHGLMGTCITRELHEVFERQLEEHFSSWQGLEATLYLLRSISENITTDEDAHVSAIISRLDKLPHHSKLKYRCMLLIGSYSEWLSIHEELLQGVLCLLLSGLSDREVAPAAAIALRDVGEVCGKQLTCRLPELLPICQDALCGNAIELRECVRLLESVVFIMSNLSIESIIPYLELLFAPRARTLSALAEAQPDQSLKPILQKELRLLSAVCRTLDPDVKTGEQHPTVTLLSQVSQSIQTLILQFQWDSETVDYFCGCLSGAIRITQTYYAPLVDWTASILFQLFSACHNPLLLDVGAQLVRMFGKDEAQFNSICILVNQMVLVCFRLFEIKHLYKSADALSLHDHTDVVQKFMNFLTSVGKSANFLGGKLDQMSRVFSCGIAALALPETATVKAACSFVCECIKQAGMAEDVLYIIKDKCMDLLTCIFKAIGGSVPRQLLDPMSDVILAMNRHCREFLMMGLMTMVRHDGFPSTNVTAVAKENFAKRVLREGVNKKRLQEIVQEFYLLCRGLI